MRITESFNKQLNNFHNFLDNKWVLVVLTVLLFGHMIATPWMPLSYLAGFNSLAARIVISILVLVLACVHPYYAILLTSVLVIALNEYNNRRASFENVMNGSMSSNNSSGMSELEKIYMEPVHNKEYTPNFPVVDAPNNISAEADTVIKPESKDIRMLINQHSSQTTDVTGGLHGIFNQTEDAKISNMMKMHPSSSTLTANVKYSYMGDTPYLTEENLNAAQTNLVGGVDANKPLSNFPEVGNRDILDSQGLNSHFPLGVDPSSTNSSKF
jgi:hypothetical protein